MKLFSMLKRNARLALRGSFGRAIIILLITAGVSMMLSAMTQTAVSVLVKPSDTSAAIADVQGDLLHEMLDAFRMGTAEWIITLVATIISVLFAAPLSLGTIRWHVCLVRGESPPVSELFRFFESGRLYATSVLFEINLGIRTLLWLVPFYAAPSAVFGISVFFLSGGEELSREALITATGGLFLSFVLFILATLFYSACVCRYTLAPYLLSEDADLTVRQAIKLSVKYTKGYRFSLLWFSLSYFGWFLLTLFILPLLYVIPYYRTGIAMYAKFIIEKNRIPPPCETREISTDKRSEQPDLAETDG